MRKIVVFLAFLVLMTCTAWSQTRHSVVFGVNGGLVKNDNQTDDYSMKTEQAGFSINYTYLNQSGFVLVLDWSLSAPVNRTYTIDGLGSFELDFPEDTFDMVYLRACRA